MGDNGLEVQTRSALQTFMVSLTFLMELIGELTNHPSRLAFHLDRRYASQGVVLQGATSQDMGVVGPLQEDD
jgi:hypothetical protein